VRALPGVTIPLGHHFTNGYLARNWVAGPAHAKTTLPDHYAAQLRYAANTFEQSDQG
jgi:hypothetical protein